MRDMTQNRCSVALCPGLEANWNYVILLALCSFVLSIIICWNSLDKSSFMCKCLIFSRLFLNPHPLYSWINSESNHFFGTLSILQTVEKSSNTAPSNACHAFTRNLYFSLFFFLTFLNAAENISCDSSSTSFGTYSFILNYCNFSLCSVIST